MRPMFISPRQNPNHPIRRRLLQLPIGGVRPRRRQGPPAHLAEPRQQFPGARGRLARALPAGQGPPVQTGRTGGPRPLHGSGNRGATHRRPTAGARRSEAETPGAKSSQDEPAKRADFHSVDVDSLELVRPRSVGVEHVGLWAMEQVGLPTLLALGAKRRAAALGSIIGRMAAPGSERATQRWLAGRSALGELLGEDFEAMGAMRLYHASDALMANRAEIEAHLFDRAMGLFDLKPIIALYDLTNTYFEGEVGRQPLAKRGHSKEKRSDCPLLTLGLVLDACGFARRSRVFAGNVREHGTLEEILDALGAPRGALVHCPG